MQTFRSHLCLLNQNLNDSQVSPVNVQVKESLLWNLIGVCKGYMGVWGEKSIICEVKFSL